MFMFQDVDDDAAADLVKGHEKSGKILYLRNAENGKRVRGKIAMVSHLASGATSLHCALCSTVDLPFSDTEPVYSWVSLSTSHSRSASSSK